MRRVLGVGLVVLGLAGCEVQQPIVAPLPPPPPAYVGRVPELVQLAQRNGYRAGFEDGGGDAYYRRTYAPREDARYQDAPGYDYRMGPVQAYVDAYRNAFLRGYERGFAGNQGYDRR